MAACILRIDLSAAARDFQLVAIEAGVPLLDRTGANYATLRRWLGTFVAEPVWEADESVLFFIADEHGGRLEQVECSPATTADLQGPLKEEVEAFLGRLGKIKPITEFEKQLLPLVSQRLSTLRGGGHGDEDCQFFKCRRGKGNWRLVWCWAHKRKDLQPATATICPREDCSQLYLVRRGAKARCPRCSAAARGVPHGSAGRKLAWATLVLLLLLGGAAAYLATGPQDLAVTPQQWSGPAGSRITFAVNQRYWRFWNRDVTSRVVAQAHDRRKLEFEPGGSLAMALAPGKTSASFFLDDQRAEVPVDIGPPKAPDSMVVEPGSVSVAVGSTAPLKVIGKYGNDLAIDLSGMVSWLPQNAQIASVALGRVEGQNEGKTTLKARFIGTPGAAPEASVAVTVTPAALKTLAIRFDPPKFSVGSRSKLRVMATDAAGREHEVIGSSQLKLEVDPPAIAEINADWLVGREDGAAMIRATLGKLTAEATFDVAPAAVSHTVANTVLSVQPEHLTMAVDETLPLSIVAGGSEPVVLATSDPKVVDVPGNDDVVVGRGPGHAEITVSQGKKHKTVQVDVVDSPIVKLWIEPMLATVAVGSDLPIRVMGLTKSGVELQVAPDRLKWSAVPAKEYAQFDSSKLLLRGVAPMPKEKEQELVATLGPDVSATAIVDVYPPGMPLAEHDTLKHSDKIVGTGRVDTSNHDIDFGKYPSIGGGGGVGHGKGKHGRGGGGTGGGGTGGGGRGVGGVGTGGYDGTTVIKHRHGDRVVVRDGHTVIDDGRPVVGIGDRTVDVSSDDALVVRDVRLLGVHISEITPKDFRAEFELDLAQKGQYRLVDDDHQSLSEWTELGPSSNARLTAQSMPRTGDDEYDPFVERKIDGKSRYFQLPFALKLQK